MRRFWPIILFIVIFAIALWGINKPSSLTESNSQQSPQRIISLSPSITEILYALDLSDKIIAVTDYCDYPPSVQSLPKIGGFINPNLEKIISLRPDLVILLANHSQTIGQLKQLNIKVLTVNNTRLATIQQSIEKIGQLTQHQSQAQQLLAQIKQQITLIRTKVADRPKPRVMLTMGHSLGNEHIKQVYIAGQHDFYNDLINLAGGVNAYQGTRLKVPSLSIEGIMQLNPDVIIDVFPEADDHRTDLQQTLKKWQSLSFVNAVENNRIHIIEQDYATVPGPRIFQLLPQMAKIIHPNVNW